MSSGPTLSRLSFLIVVSVVTACATTGAMRNEPLDAGVAQTFQYAYPRVAAAAKIAVVQDGMAIDTIENPDSNTTLVIARRRSANFSPGRAVRVVVQRLADTTTVVRIVSKVKASFNIGYGADYSGHLFSLMTSELQAPDH